MGEQISSQEPIDASPLESFVSRARAARTKIMEEREQLDALLKNPQQQKELDLNDPEGDLYDETFRGTTYR